MLLIREDAHTLPLWVCISAWLRVNEKFLCVLAHFLLSCVSNNKLCTCFFFFFLIDFTSLGNVVFIESKNPGKICL